MNINWNEPSTDPSEKLYKISDEVAARASKSAKTSRDAWSELLKLKEKAKNWDEIMSTAYVIPFFVAFIIICVLEYFFSRELYRDILPHAPLIIGVGLITISIVISEFLVGVMSGHTRRRRFYEEKQIILNHDKPDEDIEKSVKKHSQLYFIIGVVAFVVLGFAIYYLSRERVRRELFASIRQSPFGIQDLLPVIFYVLEVLTGLYVFYLFKRIMLAFKIRNHHKKFEENITRCRKLTSETCEKFDEAIKMGYNPVTDDVSENIHLAFFRNKNLGLVQQHIEYFDEPKFEEGIFKCNIKSHEGSAVLANVVVLSEYKYSQKGATDQSSGELKLKLKTFPNDEVMNLCIENKDGNGQLNKIEKDGPYSINGGTEVHTMLI